MLYEMACDFGQRPSAWLPGLSEVEALTVDAMAFREGRVERNRRDRR